MLKLMHKKLNKKGFTLAELLVVVAIIAILVAIAIPIFTKAIENAQKKTNDANIRSTKAAAVTQILDEWETFKEGKEDGWFAIGHVDAKGDLVNVTVYMYDMDLSTIGKTSAVGAFDSQPNRQASNKGLPFAKYPVFNSGTPANTEATQGSSETNHWVSPDSDNYGFTSSRGTTDGYYTLVYIDDVEEVAQGIK